VTSLQRDGDATSGRTTRHSWRWRGQHFPHHEAEIAQAEGCTEKQFVRYWLHCANLLFDGQKVSTSLSREGHIDEAIACWQKSLEIAPRSPAILNSLAWVLSTCSDAHLRNGSRAIQLAQEADQLAGGKNPVFARTLAAAYAESGRFNDATGTAQRALELAVGKNDFALASELRMDIDLYRMNFPRR
jgi:tetratricopeptide (TPR) repeat protein